MTPLYCDNHLLAADKPGGLLTQPSGTDEDSLEAQAKLYVKVTYSKPGNVFLEAVHRIDRPACGIVLFARTSKALTRANQAMRQKSCAKVYRAILEGRPDKDSGTLTDWLRHDDFHAEIVRPDTPEAKPCTLQYRILKPLGTRRTLVEIALETGRYHQIRAQFASRGWPLVGDVKYGASAAYANGAIALQHYQLTVPHPTTGEPLVIQSALDIQSLFT